MSEKKALGKGLGALIGEGRSALGRAGGAGGEGRLRELPLAEIAVNRRQPRRSFAADELEELAASIRALGVVITMYDGRTRLGREVAGEVREHLGQYVFDTVVPRNVRLSEAPSHGLPISRYDATCAGSDAYFDLAKEVVSRD